MTRRRRKEIARTAGYLAAMTGTEQGWAALGHPFHSAGLWIGEGVTVAVWPLAVLCLIYGPPALAARLVPRSWRASWRYGRDTRPHIPVMLRRAVYRADRWRCVACGWRADLQLDHVFPWSLGGNTSLWNMVTLCGRCNRVKSNFWIWQSGRLTYRPFEGADRPQVAAGILAMERRARRRPWRWIRAAYILAA